ncbi:MAG TPA: single-stranded-DNA-specific exonuclease RecJ [Anaerolineales bacterium]|nr:single-stranded-DNA-specific exonuclease RecJ [Anaerolineales bacterium]
MSRWLDPQPVNTSSLDDLNLHPLVAQTLTRRGIKSTNAAQAFLHLGSSPSIPFPGIEKAVERVHSAIQDGVSICIWGDFDVDGQTSTAVLVQTLGAMKANVTFYIPIRGKEGHGIHIESLQSIIDNGAKLIVTCDTGITAHEAIDYANSRGVDVVVTDHHDLGETLPNASAIINPKLLPEGHPLANLAGVGVAYKLAEALLIANHKSEIVNLLDLVALGLIADIALLKGETRLLAQLGIQALRETQRPGLKAMAELSGTNLETLTEETIGFTFAPRLNALGRLGDANPAVELLITKDPSRARVLATQIEGLNAQRRLLTSQVYEAAETKLRENPSLLIEPVVILAHSNWPGGVVGIVANKLVDRYHKPAILFTESNDGILRGSARSVEGLHITKAITTQKDILLGFGGHPMAAGLSLPAEKLTEFRKGLGRAIEKQLGEAIQEEPTLQIDAWLGLEEITLDLANALETMAPFGAGNPALTLASRGVHVKSISMIGKAKEHLRLNVEDDNGNAHSILWWGGASEELPEEKSVIDLAYSLRAGTFRGKRQLTLQFEDFRVVGAESVELQPAKVEIVDWRSTPEKFNELAKEVLIWAEATDKVKGRNRFELYPATELAIYTAPPSPADLRLALELVKPRKIYLLGVSPDQGNSSFSLRQTDDFLSRLTGLTKYVLNQRGGKVTLQELAAVTGQRVSVIRMGLEWLAAGGHISIVGGEEQESVLLSAEKGEPNPYLQKELFIGIKGILEETSAYRAHFARASVDTLIL